METASGGRGRRQPGRRLQEEGSFRGAACSVRAKHGDGVRRVPSRRDKAIPSLQSLVLGRSRSKNHGATKLSSSAASFSVVSSSVVSLSFSLALLCPGLHCTCFPLHITMLVINLLALPHPFHVHAPLAPIFIPLLSAAQHPSWKSRGTAS